MHNPHDTLGSQLQNWVQVMANHSKQVDPNHMVTVGYEGYWSKDDPRAQYNPGNGWAGISGQDFTRNMGHAEIDFTGIHFWPDLWFATGTQQQITVDQQTFLSNWMLQHAKAAAELGKPLFLEEFGKAVKVRTPLSAFCLLLLVFFPATDGALHGNNGNDQNVVQHRLGVCNDGMVLWHTMTIDAGM